MREAIWLLFLSTLSLRRATPPDEPLPFDVEISIHALLAESDFVAVCYSAQEAIISIHALLAESDKYGGRNAGYHRNFYPRSPCGERPLLIEATVQSQEISIHALLAESDASMCAAVSKPTAFLSTLSLRRATAAAASIGGHPHISIHALLAESDVLQAYEGTDVELISIHALLAESDAKVAHNPRRPGDFYPRSPCGERRWRSKSRASQRIFLSTLSLRRATRFEYSQFLDLIISIHALLAESDHWTTYWPRNTG